MDNNQLIKLLEENKKKVRVENLSMSIGEIISMYEKKEIKLRPEYQRLLKWDNKQKTLLIESLLLSLPTPSVFVSADDEGKWEVVDGLQRISTFIDFIYGLREEDTKDIPNYIPFKDLSDDLVYLQENDVNFVGCKFEDFDRKIQLDLKRQRINVVILLSGTSEDVKYELFQRLNEGGTRITPMELRNAILTYQHRDVWEEMEKLRNSDVYKKFINGKQFKKDDSYNGFAPILYFLTLYRKADDILNKTAKVDNVDLYITKYVRTFDKEQLLNDLKLLVKIFQIIDNLDFEAPTKIFYSRNVKNETVRYSDTVFGAITLGMAFNFDNLPNDEKLQQAIMLTYPKLSEDKIVTRGFSAFARIPKMINFAKNDFI
jgi:hypothetical protein